MTANDVTLAIGIDLGTSYSCVGIWRNEAVEIITNEQGNRTTPSLVSFTPDECLVGEGAMNQRTRFPANTIYDMQRLVGRRFNDPQLQEDIKSWPFKVIKGTYGLPKVVVEDKGKEKLYSAEEISSMVLVKLKDDAQSFLNTTVKDTVITVPAYFNESHCQATMVAAHLAGLHVLQIIYEPVSAAIAYGLHMKTVGTNVLIFDLDYDRFDVSLVTVIENGKLKVRATCGDPHFGSLDTVNNMVDYFVNEFNRKHKVDIRRNFRAIGMLKVGCAKAYEDLISITETAIFIDCLHEGIDFSTKINRVTYEFINRSLFSKCIDTVASCIRDAKINKTDVDHIVLAGGSTRIPKLQKILREFFNGKDLCKSIPVEEVIAYGATILARDLRREKDGNVNISNTEILPLLNIVPLSLGVSADDGVFSVIIPRNTPIPAEKENIYFTTRDNQTSISFNVYQGERSRAIDNNWLAKFEAAVSPAPKGKSKVKVVFKVDADGILNCWVKEFTTGLKKKINIDNDRHKLSEQEINKMLQDAEKYKLEDQEYKKIMCARNVLEEYIYNVKRKMKTIGTTEKTWLHAEEINEMEDAIETANRFVDGNLELADFDEYQKVLNQLEKICVAVIAQLV